MRTAILLATYNGERFLREQISSLMDQTVSDFAVYIHDDGSTDGTRARIEECRERFPGRIELLEGAPTGSAKENFWYMLSCVEADVYFFCDQDDVWLPVKVEKEREALLALGSMEAPGLVFSDMKVCGEDLSVMDDSFWHYIGRDAAALRVQRVIVDNPAAGTSMCFNRALRDEAVRWSPDLSDVEMHDGLLLAMALLVGRVGRIDEGLVLYRQHGANEMGAARSETAWQRLVRNLSDLFSGRLAANKQEFVKLSKAAAAQLSRIDALKAQDRRMLKAYANIDRMPKWQRIRFLKQNGFDRAKNTWWFYLWI